MIDPKQVRLVWLTAVSVAWMLACGSPDVPRHNPPSPQPILRLACYDGCEAGYEDAFQGIPRPTGISSNQRNLYEATFEAWYITCFDIAQDDIADGLPYQGQEALNDSCE